MSGISKRVSGSWVSGDYGIMKTATDTITTLPAIIYADGNSATVGLKGNMSQTGTPSPSSPIQPSECGDLSENLYDASNPNIFTGYYNATTNTLLTTPNNAFIYIPLVQGRKYYVYGCKRYNTSTSIRWATTSSAPFYNIPCIRTGQFAQTDIFTITAEANENYLAIFLCGDSDYSAYGTVEDAIATNGANLVIDNGYKIPISSASTTTPVYLGEVQSTRRIRELVLTGEETISYSSSNNTFVFTLNNGYYTGSVRTTPLFCSHYIHIDDGRSFSNMPNNSIYIASYGSATGAYIYSTNYADLSDFKAYLQQQYAAGTPVCVWYVLATEETGIVNEPIRKIGDYADTVSGITIPTTAGGDTLSVDTTVQPSEVTVNYKGWHNAVVHEKSRNLFDKDAKNVNNGYITNGFLQSDGSITTNIDYRASEYIRISQNQSYTLFYGSNLSLPSVCFYDSAKNYISGIAYAGQWSVLFTTPQNAEYLRLSFRAVDPSSIMLNSGSGTLPYEPYWK